jgi:hypothetical protein
MSNRAQSIISSHKEAAKRATDYLGTTRKLPLKQADALELVARVLGVANWQTLNAMAKQGQAPRMPGPAPLAILADDGIETRARRMAELYSVQTGWKEHPFLLREDWVSCDSGADDGFDYWRFVVRRLDELKAVMPWDRDEVEEVKVARAGGIDIDIDFDSENWVVASAEDGEFLDQLGTASELQAWQDAAASVGVVVAYHLDTELPWSTMSLAEKLEAIGRAMPWVAEAKAKRTSDANPKLVPPPDITREVLINGGFKPTVREGFAGEFLVKTMRAYQMPYTLEHIVGTDDDVSQESVVTLEVDPQGMLTMSIGDVYKEDPVAINHPDGRGTLRDAGVDV